MRREAALRPLVKEMIVETCSDGAVQTMSTAKSATKMPPRLAMEQKKTQEGEGEGQRSKDAGTKAHAAADGERGRVGAGGSCRAICPTSQVPSPDYCDSSSRVHDPRYEEPGYHLK
jgi:hypothetical protein